VAVLVVTIKEPLEQAVLAEEVEAVQFSLVALLIVEVVAH
jgi:hypothetical protein